MRRLAEFCGADADLWEVVGLCHDLDYFKTSTDLTRHGLLTLTWLGDRLPAEARAAIASHDHRTGVLAVTPVADMLKLADAIAVMDARLGRSQLCALDPANPYDDLAHRLGEKQFLGEILQKYANKHGLEYARLVSIILAAPTQ